MDVTNQYTLSIKQEDSIHSFWQAVVEICCTISQGTPEKVHINQKPSPLNEYDQWLIDEN